MVGVAMPHEPFAPFDAYLRPALVTFRGLYAGPFCMTKNSNKSKNALADMNQTKS